MSMGEPAPHDIFTDNHRWGDLDEWNRSALALHEQGGIHRIERDGFTPFWAVIDHAAVLDIERQPELFTNGPIPVLTNIEAYENRGLEIKTLIHMDAPDHTKYRKLTNEWFKPASIKRLNDRLQQLSDEALAKLESFGGECDFATDIALGPIENVVGGRVFLVNEGLFLLAHGCCCVFRYGSKSCFYWKQ